MYVENLCENCTRGPYICSTKNCEEDRINKYGTTQNITFNTTRNSTEYIVYEPAKTTQIQLCAFDSLPEDCKGEPMMLYCSCPKCSPRY